MRIEWHLVCVLSLFVVVLDMALVCPVPGYVGYCSGVGPGPDKVLKPQFPGWGPPLRPCHIPPPYASMSSIISKPTPLLCQLKFRHSICCSRVSFLAERFTSKEPQCFPLGTCLGNQELKPLAQSSTTNACLNRKCSTISVRAAQCMNEHMRVYRNHSAWQYMSSVAWIGISSRTS